MQHWQLVVNMDSKAKIVMTSELSKEIVKAVENTEEQAIFVFDSSGLFIRVSDPYRARVVELVIPKERFTDYEFTGNSDSQLRAGIVISRLKDITKTLRKGDTLELVYSSGESRIQTQAGILRRDIRLIKSELLADIPVISVAFEYEVDVDYSTISQFLKASNGKGHLCDFITDGGFIMACETDEGTVRIKREVDECGMRPANHISMTTFSVEHTIKALALGNDLIRIRGKQDSAVEFSWISKTGINMRAWVAPRV